MHVPVSVFFPLSHSVTLYESFYNLLFSLSNMSWMSFCVGTEVSTIFGNHCSGLHVVYVIRYKLSKYSLFCHSWIFKLVLIFSFALLITFMHTV